MSTAALEVQTTAPLKATAISLEQARAMAEAGLASHGAEVPRQDADKFELIYGSVVEIINHKKHRPLSVLSMPTTAHGDRDPILMRVLAALVLDNGIPAAIWNRTKDDGSPFIELVVYATE